MQGRAVFISKIEDGKVNPTYRDKISSALKSLDGELVKITIEKYSKTRTNNQNAYYWSVVLNFVRAILRLENPDATLEDAHEFCKTEEIGNLTEHKIVIVKDTTHVLTKLRSTTDLTTIEFEEYLDRIRQWALREIGVIIPLPNEELEQYYIEPKDR